MDAFKAWPGRAESIVISQESYMRCTGGVAPWRRDGDKGPSYYAVCPLCDNPIQIVGLFRRQEESRAHRPYGRHHRGDVPGLCRYDEDAYLHCPYADPNHRTDTRARRHPKDQTGRALYGLMRGEFDRVTLAWDGSPASIWGRGPPVTCFATRRSGYAACWAAMTGNRPSMT